MSALPSGAGVGVALRRVVVGYRIVGVVWLWLLIGMALRESRAEWSLLVATGLLATVWTAITVAVAERRPVILRAPWWVVADVGVTVALILMSSMARPERGFLGGYPFSTVLVAGFGSGYPGAFASAIVLSIVSARVLIGGEAINSALVYLVARASRCGGSTSSAATTRSGGRSSRRLPRKKQNARDHRSAPTPQPRCTTRCSRRWR